MDYDTLFMSAPDSLFESTAFQRTGTLLFYDRPGQAAGKMKLGLHHFMRRQGQELFNDMHKASWYQDRSAVGAPKYPSAFLKASDIWKRDVFGADRR